MGLTLNYLATQGVATILTETTLVTTEEQTAKFHAGGEILIKTQGVTSEGQPTVSYEPKEYGIILEMLASKIVNDGYIDLNINTKSTKLDWANAVDGIPSFKNQSVETKVIIKDSTTIVLGGLIDNKDSKNLTKIPVLGDIPIIGNLFRSKDFQNGNSELVFFITPEIVNPVNNTQNFDFNNIEKSNEQKQKAGPRPRLQVMFARLRDRARTSAPEDPPPASSRRPCPRPGLRPPRWSRRRSARPCRPP